MIACNHKKIGDVCTYVHQKYLFKCIYLKQEVKDQEIYNERSSTIIKKLRIFPNILKLMHYFFSRKTNHFENNPIIVVKEVNMNS